MTEGQFTVHSFHELKPEELYKILHARNAVFVVEQNCAYADTDFLDQDAKHIYSLSSDDDLAGYARILPPGLTGEYASIGRVLVMPRFRGRKLGEQLMQFCISYILQQYPGSTIHISAQQYLTAFYTRLGFLHDGTEYLEDGIPHIGMNYHLT